MKRLDVIHHSILAAVTLLFARHALGQNSDLLPKTVMACYRATIRSGCIEKRSDFSRYPFVALEDANNSNSENILADKTFVVIGPPGSDSSLKVLTDERVRQYDGLENVKFISGRSVTNRDHRGRNKILYKNVKLSVPLDSTMKDLTVQLTYEQTAGGKNWVTNRGVVGPNSFGGVGGDLDISTPKSRREAFRPFLETLGEMWLEIARQCDAPLKTPEGKKMFGPAMAEFLNSCESVGAQTETAPNFNQVSKYVQSTGVLKTLSRPTKIDSSDGKHD